MRTLHPRARRFGDDKCRAIAEGREPRLDVSESTNMLNADVFNFFDVDKSPILIAKAVTRALAASADVARHPFNPLTIYGPET
jgi:hypothetical protein